MYRSVVSDHLPLAYTVKLHISIASLAIVTSLISSRETHQATNMSPTKVGVIGAGLAGITLSIFLKAKGYEPMVYERTDGVPDMGLSIG